MKTEQKIYTADKGWQKLSLSSLDVEKVQLVMLFGDRDLLSQDKLISDIKAYYPNAEVVGCSTAGEICKDEVITNSIVSTAIEFDKTQIKVVSGEINGHDSFTFGQKLAAGFDSTGLKHIFILSEGININGSQLTVGLNSVLGNDISVTGGLAGDYGEFKETGVIYNAAARKNIAVAIGFYGDSLQVGYGSKGGWNSFGVDRLVTKSEANVLYELDGKPALSIYKTYLGAHAAQLPASALLFPISFRSGEESLVRTILSINEEDGSMIFAGDVPQGETVRFMSSSVDKLNEGAMSAAENALSQIENSDAELAFLVSCVGRKIVMKTRTDEEIEAVRDVLGESAAIIGFYSFGEICPTLSTNQKCELHNQTMTVTLLKEM